jgi:hypothetical protein
MKKCFSNLTFLAALLMLPICLCSNVAAPQTLHNQQVSTPTSKQSRAEKLLKKYIKKLTTTNPDDKKRRRERIALWIIAGLAAITIIYLLQGSFWLTVIAVLVGVGINWRRIFPRRYSEYETPYMQYEERDYKSTQSTTGTSNKFSNRSFGLLLGYILSLGLALGIAASALGGGVLAVILLLTGILLLIGSFVSAIQAVKRKESKSTLAMILSSIFMLILLLWISLFIIFAF